MFKTKMSFFVFTALALALALGLVAFASFDTAAAAVQAGPGGQRGGGRGFGGQDTTLAEALGITLEELQEATQTAQAAAIDQAIANGLVTQEQAEAMAERGFGLRMPRGRGSADSAVDFDVFLADALGISVDELAAARESARQAALEDAIADGKISQEQYALMEARQALHNSMDKDEILVKALGITSEELTAARDEGLHIADILEDLGIDQADFEANMQAAWEEAVVLAVDEGVLTQEQADLILEAGMMGPRPLGGPGGHGGRGGRGCGMEGPFSGGLFPGRDFRAPLDDSAGE
ncbi:MAG: hypothetical protein MUO62_12935 [Anaerolineales bacterium]|nr:hypothetical protein [Anaerolineales bacterium]